jgi:hypothetical protein
MSYDTKRLETLRARAALAGVVLHAVENDAGQRTYILTKWALTRDLDSLEAVSAWLDSVADPEPVLAGAGGVDE